MRLTATKGWNYAENLLNLRHKGSFFIKVHSQVDDNVLERTFTREERDGTKRQGTAEWWSGDYCKRVSY